MATDTLSADGLTDVDRTEVCSVGPILTNLPHEAESDSVAIQKTLELTHRLIGSGVAAYFSADPSGKVAVSPECTVPVVSQIEIIESLSRFAQIAFNEQAAQAAKIHEHEFIVSVPVLRQDHQIEVISVILHSENEDLSKTILALQFVANYIANWRGRPTHLVRDRQLLILQSLTKSIQATSADTEIKKKYARFAETLRQLFQSQVAALATPNRFGRFSISTIVPNRQFDAQSELVKSFDSVVQEAKIRADEDPELTTLDLSELKTDAFEQLKLQTKAANHYAIFLRDTDSRLTAICLVPLEEHLSPDSELAASLASSTIGSQISLHRKAQPGIIARSGQTLKNLAKNQGRRVILVPLLLIAMVLSIPFPMKIKCDTELQPRKRRLVSASFDGRLESVFVEPGDLIKKGETIARMDAREIQWELDSLEADYNRAKKERDTASAPPLVDRAKAQIAEYEMQRLEGQRQLLKDRILNLDIRSPIDGVVLSGEMDKLEGARLKMGQTLIEVGPLDEIVFEIAIPDNTVSHVQVGNEVFVKLDSLPNRTFRGVMDRIHPRSEQREHANVFIGEVHLANPADVNLRPGMGGRAKIVGRRHPLAWNLFHRAIEQLVFRIGW